jgi:putative tryptophan/tyrosine transport system substrate-binding protein
MTRDVLLAARAIGIEIQVLKASSDVEIDAAFDSLIQTRAGALLVGADAFFNNRIERITTLASRHSIPVMYPCREYVVAGGPISYGAGLTELYRQVGLYAGGSRSGFTRYFQATGTGGSLGFPWPNRGPVRWD